MTTIVVARYHECVRWTKEFSNVIIYNKGLPLDPEYADNEVRLPKNVGREGHTYYTFICQNYDNLPEHIIFLQGNPYDHSYYVQPNIKSFVETPQDFAFFSAPVEHTTFEIQRNGHWQCCDLYDNYEQIFGVKCDEKAECIFSYGGQFAVSRRAILKRPKQFYENIVRMLEHSVDPLEGYVIERLHKHIFD